MHKALDYGGRRDLLGSKHGAQTEAWLTELYTEHSNAANGELLSDELIQANTTSDQIAVRDREIAGAPETV
jgi:hypothetical protein